MDKVSDVSSENRCGTAKQQKRNGFKRISKELPLTVLQNDPSWTSRQNIQLFKACFFLSSVVGHFGQNRKG
jgi:hypothetical protein